MTANVASMRTNVRPTGVVTNGINIYVGDLYVHHVNLDSFLEAPYFEAFSVLVLVYRKSVSVDFVLSAVFKYSLSN
jgi:hypothetical protein